MLGMLGRTVLSLQSGVEHPEMVGLREGSDCPYLLDHISFLWESRGPIEFCMLG